MNLALTVRTDYSKEIRATNFVTCGKPEGHAHRAGRFIVQVRLSRVGVPPGSDHEYCYGTLRPHCAS